MPLMALPLRQTQFQLRFLVLSFIFEGFTFTSAFTWLAVDANRQT